MTLPRLIRFADLKELGYAHLVNAADFPGHVQIGPRTRVWRSEDIDAWVAMHPDHPPQEEAKEPRQGFVYFIRCGEFVKIGFTTNINGRLAALAAASPNSMHLLYSLPGSVRSERELHRRFKEQRHNREWFCLSGTLLAFLQEEGCNVG